MKKLCEVEMDWEPPQEYLKEWSETVLGVHRLDPNLLKVASGDKTIAGYCISVKKLHDYQGVVLDIIWKSESMLGKIFLITRGLENRGFLFTIDLQISITKHWSEIDVGQA